MNKGILEFSLPDDETSMKQALFSGQAFCEIDTFREYLRGMNKHGIPKKKLVENGVESFVDISGAELIEKIYDDFFRNFKSIQLVG